MAIAAAQVGHRIAFAPATGWISRLAEAHGIGRLQAELRKISAQSSTVITLQSEGCSLFDRNHLPTFQPELTVVRETD
ncbi:hypothetical protein [Mycolicibacterium aubagnense]|uniref:hypothetical protein n=1 Tax=Mycolicibacterium aubagnense TaxID=319707 RepID=UPI0038994761